ncbi:MAG: acyl-CoA synthetase FdrA [Burkholderiales bacterium]
MSIVTKIKPNLYKDSVALMLVAEQVLKDPGITRATLIMGTPANLEILAEAGLADAPARAAGPSDLIIVIESGDPKAADEALSAIDAALSGGSKEVAEAERILPRTIAMGTAALDGSNLVQVSVPGAYAGAEALKAVKAGHSVFLFSDNVPLAQERVIKDLAAARGALVMGPDCGTAIIAGVPLGFANVVRRGRIGFIGASGTGLQEVTSQVHIMGEGVSHAIGTGGRDIKAEIGGLTMLAALDLLANDPATAVIGIVSKPPAPQVMAKVVERAARAGKPVVACFLGGKLTGLPANITATSTLYDCAAACVARVRGTTFAPSPVPASQPQALPAYAASQRHVRGLFSGGTFCTEAQVALRDAGIACRSNVPLNPTLTLADIRRSQEHTILDLGDDDFTVGKPHPMIDPSTRVQRIRSEAEDPTTAVLLIDIVLGYAGHMDPAGAVAPALKEASAAAHKAGRTLAMVGFVCGTEEDPQVRSRQEKVLADAGVMLAPSSSHAARLAAALLPRKAAA